MDIRRDTDAVIEKHDRKWHFEGNTLTTVIYVAETKVSGKVTVRVFRSADLMARRGELNGFAGAMTRLQAATDTLRHAWPFSTVPDELIDAAQAGDRLSYYPNTASQELTHFRQVLEQAKAKVEAVSKAGISDQQKRALAAALGPVWETPEAKAAVADYPNKIARVLAEIHDTTGVQP
jgi:alpha-glucosidase